MGLNVGTRPHVLVSQRQAPQANHVPLGDHPNEFGSQLSHTKQQTRTPICVASQMVTTVSAVRDRPDGTKATYPPQGDHAHLLGG